MKEHDDSKHGSSQRDFCAIARTGIHPNCRIGQVPGLGGMETQMRIHGAEMTAVEWNGYTNSEIDEVCSETMGTFWR
jgi:hypothetical protein